MRTRPPAAGGPARWERRAVRAGDWRITALSDGTFRLDGGSMWGVVPAVLWRELTPPAPDNTIPLALRPFLLERGDLRVVLEVGIGGRWSEKERRIYGMRREPTLVDTLAACGLGPGDVTHVVASHCHWDHVGGMVVEGPEGLAPQFPRARHHAPAVEVAMAKRPGHARAASYRASDVEPIERLGLLDTYAGRVELLPGLHAEVVGGHSDGVSLITVNADGPGATAVFWTDVVPTRHHVQPPYVMAFDLDVARSFEVRGEWLARAADGGWIGLFYHDPDVAFGRVARAGGRYAFVPVEGEARP